MTKSPVLPVDLHERNGLNGEAQYWTNLCRQLRLSLNLTQKEMAARLGINQATLSRWERGLTEPQFESRELIQALAQGQGLGAVDDLENVVRVSPFPMLLMDHHNRVVAASERSGFTPGLPVIEQTPLERQSKGKAFLERLRVEGFWDHRCTSLDYLAVIDGQVRRAVVSPVVLRGEVYALVQKEW